jgi:hypothetical protein
MAKLSIVVCDLCKSQITQDATHEIVLDDRRYELCNGCYNDLKDKLSKVFVLPNKKSSDAGEARIPSANLNIVVKPKCPHTHKDFDESGVTCSDCKEILSKL